MKLRLLRWLFHRDKDKEQAATPSPSWYEQRVHNLISADLDADPAMCAPCLGLATAHLTRVIDRRELFVWDDERRTWTMPTVHNAATVAEQPCEWWRNETTVDIALVDTAIINI